MEETAQEEVKEVETKDESFLENDPLNSIFQNEMEIAETVKEEAVTAPVIEEKVNEETVVTTEPEVEKKDPDSGWKAAYFAEKAKRQAYQEKIKEPEKKEFDWQNPEKTIEDLKNELKTETQTRFLSLSEAQCKARNTDYDEKYNVFVKMAQENPAVVQSMLTQPDPAQYAYDLAKQKMFTDEIGKDPVAYREKIAAEERAKIENEFKTKAEEKARIANSLPPSAANMSDKVPISGAIKDPLEALFPGQISS